MSKKVTGIGGIFFKAKDPETTKKWYAQHLGLKVDAYGSTFWWKDQNDKDCLTQWSPFKDDTDYFDPSAQSFMVNYRVDNLSDLVTSLQASGVELIGEIQEFDYGKFAWIMDPDGHKIELWEPVDDKLK
ncbi:MAG: Uncharacterised protein [Formosa sp. Hel3_A1_48]|jgi:predicted enzyme related to lactoylglutathione lyase|nr:MAG: Uncharacterised protein [Formosa sp. Hel3_A1_48]